MAYFATGAALTSALNALPASLTGSYKAFDAFHYAAQYMTSYSGTLTPVEHFVQVGAARGYQPNADFNPAFYASKYSDLAGLDAADLLYHYVKFGLNEGRAGNATLAAYNWADYLTAYPDVAAYVAANLESFAGSATNGAIAHYVKFGAQQGFTLPTTTVGQPFTLTAGVDAVNGTAGNDTITGLINSSGGYSVGDNIIGGAGTDTLNLIAQSASDAAGGLVSVAGVENVNVRLLTTAGAALTINAADWTGVAVLSNASSVAGTLLQVSGLATTTKVNLVGDTDINVGYNSTTTATSAVTIALTNAGDFATGGHTLAGTGLATANIDLDLANAGLVTSVNVEINGAANAARLEAGSNVATYTLSGAGSAVLVTDDTITSFDASAMVGGVDITFQGASEVVAKGGAGNDTFRYGTTISNSDSVNGGAGTDTVSLTVAGFNRNLNTSNVESASVTFSEAAGGTLNASASTINAYTLVAGTAGNAASISQMVDASTVTLNDDDLGNVTLDYASGATTTTLNLGSVSGAVVIGTLAITDVANVTINSVGVSGAVGGTIGSASFDSDLKSLAITTSGGEADLVIGTADGDISLGGATSLVVTTNGSASIAMATADIVGTALATLTVAANGSDAGDITLGDVTGAALSTINLAGSLGADVIVGTLDLGAAGSAATAGTLALNIVQAATSNMTVGNIVVAGQEDLTISVTQNGTGATATLGTITLTDTGTADAVSDLKVNSVTVAANGQVNVGAIAVTTGTGTQVTFDAITVGQDGYFGVSGIGATAVANADVSAITLNVGASAETNFGVISTTGGAVGAVTVTLAAGATATFGTVTASAVGAISINAATGAGAAIGNIGAVQTVGSIEIGGVDGATATVGTIAASAVGAIAVSGAMDVTFGTITATTIGSIDASNLGKSGAFTIDLSGVTNAIEVRLGAGTNTILSGDGRDVITLAAGTTGNDVIRYTTANATGTDSIIGFFAGTTGADQIEIGASALGLVGQSGQGVVMTAGAEIDLFFVSAGTATMTAADSIIVIGTAYASTAGMLAAVVDGGAQEIVLNGTAVTGSTYTIVWTDGNDSYVSLLSVAGATGVSLTTGTITTLTQIAGVTPGALVAANFDFV